MSYKVILADDLLPILEEYVFLLENQPNISVVGTASSGRGIVKLAKSRDFDLALIDIEMETAGDGIKATREILSENKDAKIAFLTAHDNKEIILTAMATGAVDYIVKDVSEQDFIRHVQNILNGNTELDKSIQSLLLGEYQRMRNSENKLLETINRIKHLTNAETELVKYLLQGKSQKQIAQIRHVELVTIKTQISSILKKFGVTKSKYIVKLIQELEIENLFM